MSLSSVKLASPISVPFARYLRSGPLAFSLLPRGIRNGRPDIELQAACRTGTRVVLAAAVVGQALPHLGRHLLHLAGEALQGGLRRAVAHSTEDDIACVALDDGAHGGATACALHEDEFLNRRDWVSSGR